MKYIPVAGTHGSGDGWVVDNQNPFTLAMRADGLEPYRKPDGTPIFNWPAKLAGLWWQGIQHWQEWGHELARVVSLIPFDDRNLIGHSHGGNLIIIAAELGVKMRTVTTISTPRRHDVPAEDAAKNIGYWQHVFDPEKDWIASMKHRTLGQIGDGDISMERRFLIPGVQNIGIPKARHSRIFTRPDFYHWLKDAGIVDGIIYAK